MISKAKGNQTAVTGYYDPDAAQRLKALTEKTRVSQAVYLRDALDDFLKKNTLRMVSGCFGMMDANFAIHPADTDRAKVAIKAAKAAGATFEDFEQEMVWYCYKQVTAPGMLQGHIAKQ